MNSLDWTTGWTAWTTGLIKNVVLHHFESRYRGQGHFKGHQEAQPHGAC